MLDAMHLAILVGAGLIMAAVFTSWIAFRVGAPILLIFLSVGLIAGESGLGIAFDNARAAYFVGSVALAIILFDSGFETRLSTFRQAALPAAVLSTLGVVLTALLTGLAARLVFGLPWLQSFLLGAVVGSTDAAAVFFLLRVGGIHLRERVRSVLEIESGANDPMAFFLTITLVALIAAGVPESGLTSLFVLSFLQQMGLGLAFGLAGGFLIVRLVNRLDLETGLYPIVVLAAALVLYGITGALDGSGFLAVYVAGLYAGSRRLREAIALRRFQDGMTWLAQICMFVVLGLLATPAEFPEVALQGIALAVFLIFVARPLAVWLCLLPFRFQRDETAFVAWVGLRGAVSLLLAILPLVAGLPRGQEIFNAAFIMVIASLTIQGWTVRPMARQLGLIIPPRIGPVDRVELELPGKANHELVVYHVVPGSPVVRGERIPRWARPSLIVRRGESIRPQFAGRIEAGDYVYLFTAPRNIRLLDRLFASPAKVEDDDADFFGAFMIDPEHTLGDLAQAYGVAAPGDPATPIGDYIRQRLGGSVEVGDRLSIGFVEIIVRVTSEDGRVTVAGLTLAPEQPPGAAAWPVVRSFVDLAAIARRILKRLRQRLDWSD